MVKKDVKGKGKAAVEASPPPKANPDQAEMERRKPQFSSGPEPLIIQYFSEATGAPQRGYRQNLFEEAYKSLVLEGIRREQGERADRRIAQQDLEEKTKNMSENIEYLKQALPITQSQAEMSLLKHEGDLHKCLLELTAPS